MKKDQSIREAKIAQRNFKNAQAKKAVEKEKNTANRKK